MEKMNGPSSDKTGSLPIWVLPFPGLYGGPVAKKKKKWRGLLWSRARGKGTDNRRKCSSVIELHLTRPVRLVFRLCFLPPIKGALCLPAR